MKADQEIFGTADRTRAHGFFTGSLLDPAK